jgi:flagellar biosynthesis protein FlhF
MHGAPSTPVRILTLDAARGSGIGKLQGFAGKAGISVTTVPAPDLLPALVAEARKREMVLIDTPGYAGNIDFAAGAFSNCPHIDNVHLVVPGYMRSGDLRRCIQRYKVFGPSRLLVTKLDETAVIGSVISEAAKAGLSLSFLTHGPSIAGEIREAHLDDLVAMALGRESARAVCA